MAGEYDQVQVFRDIGIRALTTTRALGSLSTSSDEPAAVVSARWERLRVELAPTGGRIATARQVHGTHILVHQSGWCGLLRADAADGHIAPEPGTAVGVSVADCVPVFVAHPSGLVGILHAGWRGIAAGILEKCVATLDGRGVRPSELRVHFGPSICGRCYEVGRDVYFAVSGRNIPDRGPIDLRAELATRAKASGVKHVTISEMCTRCNNDRFYSHRGGDSERQFAFIVADALRSGPAGR
jgi:YfiH family protein